VNTILMVVGGLGTITIILLFFGAAKKRQGAAESKEKELKGEIEMAQGAKDLREEHKHDSRDDVINDL